MAQDSDFPIVIFVGESQYGAHKRIAEELAAGFEKSLIIDTTNPDGLDALKTIKGVRFAVGINGAGVAAATNGHNLWQQSRIPFICYFLDHPIWQPQHLAVLPPIADITVCDRSHLAITHKRLTMDNTVAFLPVGGTDIGERAEWKARDVDLLVPLTCYDPPELTAVQLALAERMKADTNTPYDELLDTVFDEFATYYNSGRSLEMVQRAQLYVRATTRTELLTAIETTSAENDYKTRYYGKGQANGTLDYPHLLRQMQRAKMVVSHSPLISEGTHERVLDAALAGAMPVCSPSQFLSDIGLHYIPIHSGREDVSMKYVSEWLARPNHDQLEHNYQLAKDHTWQARAKHLANGRM